MSKRKALGQGLDALLSGDYSITESEEDRKEQGLVFLPLDKLQPHPGQPRERFDEEALKELAESIKQQGVLQPLLAEEQEGGNYLIVAGERRWRAGRLAGLEEIPVLLRKLTREERLEIALVENIQRENLTPLEEARAYHRLMEALGLSQQEVAEKVGKNRSTVANSLRLLRLPPAVKEALDQGKLTAGHARALLAVVNPADQELLLQQILNKKLSVREAESQSMEMNRGNKGKQKKSPEAPGAEKDPEIKDLEQKLIQSLGTKVSLKGSLKKGRVEIVYYSPEDLDKIYQLLTG